MADIIIKDALVLPMTGGGTLFSGYVRVRDDRQLMRHDERQLLDSARKANRDLMKRVAALSF